MSRARAKGTRGENFFLAHLRELWPDAERAPLKGVHDQGDFVNVPWLHESKHTQKPLFQQWARVCERKADRNWCLLWKGDTRRTEGEGPYVLMPLEKYKELIRSRCF